MHASSYKNMERFVGKYLQGYKYGKAMVLDVGSRDANGSYKPLFKGWEYKGLDICPGNNVDITVKDIYCWSEVEPNSYDVVISGQAFEHMDYPWMTIGEIARVMKVGGMCCIIAPSAGPIHSVPGGKDCYRYYPDGLAALARHANLDCIEAYIGWQFIAGFEDDQWKDCVLICKKPAAGNEII